MPVLERMAAIGLPLCVHGEVTDPEVDIFDREAAFIDRVLAPLRRALPELRIVLEHVTTANGVAFVEEEEGVGATLTVHHLILNRNHLLVGGIRPHYYCLPVVKRERHRQALVGPPPAGMRASSSAPTARRTRRGRRKPPAAAPGSSPRRWRMACLAQVFEAEGALDRLESFASLNGPAFYGLPPNEARLTLERAPEPWTPRARAGDRRRAGRGLRPRLSAALARPRLKGARMFANSFPPDAEMARLTARMLLEIEAVHFRRDEPYKFTSGLASPVYIDCRKLISYPAVRSALMDFACAKLLRDAGFARFDAVAGGETAGIPFAAWIAERMALPMLYVRKKPKGFGRDAQIEGAMAEGARVLLVEDLTTDGGSKLRFAEAIRTAGAEVAHTFVVFFYGIFPQTEPALAAHGLKLHYLATWRDVLAAARDGGHFDAATLAEVEAFLDAPLDWSAAHGGVTEVVG